MAGRLATARVILAKRLAQRGVVMSGGALAAVLSQNVASAGLPTLVVSNTIKAAISTAAGQAAAPGAVSVTVAALSEGVQKAMFLSKMNSVLAVVLVAGLTLGGLGAGIGLSTNPVAVAQQPEAKRDFPFGGTKTGEKGQPLPPENKTPPTPPVGKAGSEPASPKKADRGPVPPNPKGQEASCKEHGDVSMLCSGEVRAFRAWATRTPSRTAISPSAVETGPGGRREGPSVR